MPASPQKKTGKGGQKKHGRDSRRPTKQRYNAQDRRTKSKRRRIAQSNGPAALAAWNRGDGAHMPRTKRRMSAYHNSVPVAVREANARAEEARKAAAIANYNKRNGSS